MVLVVYFIKNFTKCMYIHMYEYIQYVQFVIICAWSMADIDECARDTDGCEHNCINSVGSYFCSCNTGYALTMDSKNCTGEYMHT